MVVHLNRKLVVKIIFLLYLVFFVMSYVGGTWVYANSKYGMMPRYTSTVNNLRLLYLVLTIMLGVYEMIIQFKLNRISSIDKVLILIFFAVALYKLVDVSSLTDVQTLLFESGTPMMYIVFLVYFIGMDEKMDHVLLQISKIYGLIFLTLCVFYFLMFCFDVGYSFGIRFSSSPILYSFNNGFFMTIYALYREKKFNNRAFWRTILFLMVFSAFITTSRGWIVQTMIAVMMYFILQKRGRRVIKNILKAVGAVIAILLIIRLTSPDLMNSLIGRLGESTRSSQLETFFEQVSISDLISGLGYNASYRYLNWSNFQFIDNQVIFSCFRYGMLITALLLYFMLKPILISLSKEKIKLFQSMGIGHFILAMLGLSIYFTLSIDVCCLISYMLAGRMYSDVLMHRNED